MFPSTNAKQRTRHRKAHSGRKVAFLSRTPAQLERTEPRNYHSFKQKSIFNPSAHQRNNVEKEGRKRNKTVVVGIVAYKQITITSCLSGDESHKSHQHTVLSPCYLFKASRSFFEAPDEKQFPTTWFVSSCISCALTPTPT